MNENMIPCEKRSFINYTEYEGTIAMHQNNALYSE